MDTVEAKPAFPERLLREGITAELAAAQQDNQVLHGAWEPQIDSLTVLAIVVKLDDILPFPFAPDKIVAQGGYQDAQEALEDIMRKLKHIWDEWKTAAGGAALRGLLAGEER